MTLFQWLWQWLWFGKAIVAEDRCKQWTNTTQRPLSLKPLGTSTKRTGTPHESHCPRRAYTLSSYPLQFSLGTHSQNLACGNCLQSSTLALKWHAPCRSSTAMKAWKLHLRLVLDCIGSKATLSTCLLLCIIWLRPIQAFLRWVGDQRCPLLNSWSFALIYKKCGGVNYSPPDKYYPIYLENLPLATKL